MEPFDRDEASDHPSVTLEELADFPVSGPATLLRQSLALEALEDLMWLTMGRPAPTGSPLESLPVVPPFNSTPQRQARRSRVSGSWVAAVVTGATWSVLSYFNPGAGWIHDALRTDPTIGAPAALLPGIIVGAVWGFAIRRDTGRWVAVAGVTAAGTAIAPWGPVLTAAATAGCIMLRRNRHQKAELAKAQTLRAHAVAPASPLLSDLGTEPGQAAARLRERADELGLPCAEADPVDLVAAVVGSDAWLIATGAHRFEQAASFGVRSMGALAAVLARAAGQGEDVLGPIPGAMPWPITMRALDERLPALQSWAGQHIEHSMVREAFRRAASDLAWGGGGDDRCGRVARLLWERYA